MRINESPLVSASEQTALHAGDSSLKLLSVLQGRGCRDTTMAETPMQAMTGIGEWQKKEILMELATREPRHATTMGEDDEEDQGGGPERHPSPTHALRIG